MFLLPTLKDLMVRARTEYRANLKGSDAWVWPNNVYVSAKVVAGMTFEVFGFAAYIAKQMFAHTAPDIESLRLHGEEFGIPQKPAAPAGGIVTFTATGALSISAGAVLARADDFRYLVVDGGALPGAGTLDVSVIASTDGAAGNAVGGTPLSIVSGVTGDALAAVKDAGIVLGADVEDIESYRARILFRKRNPPHGGSAADYFMWTEQVSGVSRVFVERLWAGPGTVRVFPLMDAVYSDGIPNGANIDRVSDYLSAVQPAGATVTVAAPIAQVVDVTISGLQPDTTAVREAIINELRDTFRRLSRVAGTDKNLPGMPYLACPTTFSRSWLWQAVANASGEERHSIQLPAGDVVLASGQMATLGTISFID